jgi:hypothetical protein
VESWLRRARNRGRGASLDESSSAGPWEERFLAAERRSVRSEGASVPLDNKKAEEHKPSPVGHSLEGQLLKDRPEPYSAQDSQENVGSRLQQENFSPGGHRHPRKRNDYILTLIFSHLYLSVIKSIIKRWPE